MGDTVKVEEHPAVELLRRMGARTNGVVDASFGFDLEAVTVEVTYRVSWKELADPKGDGR